MYLTLTHLPQFGKVTIELIAMHCPSTGGSFVDNGETQPLVPAPSNGEKQQVFTRDPGQEECQLRPPFMLAEVECIGSDDDEVPMDDEPLPDDSKRASEKPSRKACQARLSNTYNTLYLLFLFCKGLLWGMLADGIEVCNLVSSQLARIVVLLVFNPYNYLLD